METFAAETIQSLKTITEQIVDLYITPSSQYANTDPLGSHLSTNQQQAINSSMVVMKQLLTDAQDKFSKMTQDNKSLAEKIDVSLNAANLEVSALRNELELTNKRLSDIVEDKEGVKCAENKENDKSQDGIEGDEKEAEEDGVSAPAKYTDDVDMKALLEHNSCLEQQLCNLQRQVSELRSAKTSDQQPGVNEYKLELLQTNQELARAKETLVAMKSDRKRLKSEKLDLLNQMKQLYGTLEDKESELRDFIRNYEERMKESDETIKQLALEKEECENEKWEILKRAREATERAVILRGQLDLKEQTVRSLEQDLQQSRQQMAQLNNDLKETSERRRSSTSQPVGGAEMPPPYQEYSTNTTRSQRSDESMGTATPRDCSIENLSHTYVLTNSADDLRNTDKVNKKKNMKTLLAGSLSRVFTKSRNRRSLAVDCPSMLEGQESLLSGTFRLATLNQENYQEKLKVVEQMNGVPPGLWKASQVLAWLEITMNMPVYGGMCAENIKSGKVLLGLSDSELGSALGISNTIHRRKLRLALDDLREPEKCKYPKCAFSDHTWVAHRWIQDIGLPQYSDMFQTQLIDGRLLNSMAKKDLEKYLGISRKFHQISILHAVELLRRLNFDREVLTDRRTRSSDNESDPIVWTNERVCDWVKSIDLEEYAINLKESGVHGALMVLEPSFNAETLATALGISPSKSYIRRHLTTEFDSLIAPVRSALEASFSGKKRTGGGSLGRSFHKSIKTDTESSKKKLVFKGSLGRAFSRKAKQDLSVASLSTTADSTDCDKSNSSTRSHSSRDQFQGIVV